MRNLIYTSHVYHRHHSIYYIAEALIHWDCMMIVAIKIALKRCQRKYSIPSRELYKVVLTEDKVREKGERVSLSVLCLLLFLLERVGSKQGKLTLF